jgi:hypothetical protein
MKALVLAAAVAASSPSAMVAQLVRSAHEAAVSCYKEGLAVGQLMGKVEEFKDLGLAPPAKALRIIKESTDRGCR